MKFNCYNPRNAVRTLILASGAAAAVAVAPTNALATEDIQASPVTPEVVEVQTDVAEPVSNEQAARSTSDEAKVDPPAVGFVGVAENTGEASVVEPSEKKDISSATDTVLVEEDQDANTGKKDESNHSSSSDEKTPTDGKDDDSKDDEPEESQEPKEYEPVVDEGTYYIETDTNLANVIDCDGGRKDNQTNIQSWESNKSGAQKWDLKFDKKTGYYTIYANGTKQVLDVQWGDAKSGTNVWLYESNNTASQQWKIVKNGGGFWLFSRLNEGLALDVSGASGDNGANIQIWEKNNSTAQRFYFLSLNPKIDEDGKTVIESGDGLYTIETVVKGRPVVDISDASKDNGANVQIYGGNSTSAQKFYFELGTDGYYTITSAASGKVLDVVNGAITPTSNVQQFERNGTDAQKWALFKNTDGTYSFINKGNGCALDLEWGNTSAGSNVWTYTRNDTAAQRFRLKAVEYLSDGIFKIASMANPNRVIDIANASSASGTQAQAWDSNDTLAQRYQVVFNKDGSFRIRTAASGGWLTANDIKSGSAIQQEGKYDTAENKRNTWKLAWKNGFYTVMNAANQNQALTLASISNGGKLELRSVQNTARQHFFFETANLISDGLYEIGSKLGKYLDVAGGQTANGTNIQVWNRNHNVAQKFYVTSKNGYYVITNARSGKAVDVSNGSTENGANVWLYDANGTDAQLWKVEINDGGSIRFVNKKSGKALDVSGGTTAAGANVQQYSVNDTRAQGWTLTPTYLGWRKVDERWYLYNDDGSIRELSRQGYQALQLWKGESTQDGSPYLFCVDTTDCRLIIFKGSAYNWTPVWDVPVGVGTADLNSTNGGTLVGRFVYNRTAPSAGNPGSGPWQGDPQVFDLGGYYYYTSIWGKMGFHSVTGINLNDAASIRAAENAQLGRHISHGCIRCPVVVAKWIYDNMVTGSVIRTYR
ncbi:MAG: RICIN domain-containing protein [Atopobiaceae bacterium]|jgi:hypothetical protein